MHHVATENLALGIGTAAAAILQVGQIVAGVPNISWAAVGLFGGGLVAWGTLRQRAIKTEADLYEHRKATSQTFQRMDKKLDGLHDTVTEFRVEMERRLPRP